MLAMISLLLLLLPFLLLTTSPQKLAALGFRLPAAGEGLPALPPGVVEDLVVRVEADALLLQQALRRTDLLASVGEVEHQELKLAHTGGQFDIPGLQAALRQVKNLDPGRERLTLRPAQETTTAEVVRLMDAVRKVQQIFVSPVEINEVKIDIGISIGVVAFPDHGRDTSLLMRRADVAMRHAKQRKSGFAVYKSESDPYSVRRLKLVGDLRRAISAGELVLHYQPQIDIARKDIIGVEALVRWQHPQQGLLPPVEFIPLAEQTGLIRPLTVWAINKALQQASIWGLQGYDMTVSVNLSVHNLLDKDLPGQVQRLLKKWKVPPERLVLEITESNLMLDPDVALVTLKQLQDMGVALSVDDFGTGYSSLAYLKTLPVSELKIDRSFVQEIMHGESDAKIIHLIANLSHNLGLTVVAEGVEDQVTWDKVADLGCDVVQGYYICKPLPPKELTAWMMTTSWKSDSSAVQCTNKAG